MAFDGVMTKSVITELQNTIVGAKVNKVFEPTKSEIILSLYNQGINYHLNISANPEFCRINLTNTLKPNPQNAYNFCMLLRKYLIGSKITKISSFDLERTIEIEFECYNDLNDLIHRKLFVEIMSRQSNIILTNENNMIIETLKHFDNSPRELLPAHEYIPVTSNKKSFLKINTYEEFEKTYYSFDEEITSFINLFINHFIGFSKPLVQVALNNLEITDNSITQMNLEKLFNYFKSITNFFGSNEISCTEFNKKELVIIPSNFENKEDFKLSNEIIPNAPINTLIDDFYINKETNNLFITSRNNLLKVVLSSLKKVSKKIENINHKLSECDDLDKYRLYGELLTANLYKFNSNYNYDSVTVENYYEENKPITIPLDKSISLQKNIEKLFKKYNKLKNALVIVTKQKEEAENELNYIETIVFNLSNSKNVNDIHEVYEEISNNVVTKKEINKKSNNIKKKEKPQSMVFETVDIDGYTVYIGKNNIQNDYISLKLANPKDIWFHVQTMHGSHILLRNPENLDLEDLPENVLHKCALLAKDTSKAANDVNVSIDYCYAKLVKKAQGAKPGMVIYNNYKTMIVK